MAVPRPHLCEDAICFKRVLGYWPPLVLETTPRCLDSFKRTHNAANRVSEWLALWSDLRVPLTSMKPLSSCTSGNWEPALRADSFFKSSYLGCCCWSRTCFRVGSAHVFCFNETRVFLQPWSLGIGPSGRFLFLILFSWLLLLVIGLRLAESNPCLLTHLVIRNRPFGPIPFLIIFSWLLRSRCSTANSS